VIFDLAAMGLAASFFIVPLYALVQHRSEEKTRSQVIAANNILNALFMVLSAGATVVLYGWGMTTPQLFVLMAVLNSLASIYIFCLLPEFVLRFVLWALAKTIYRLRYDERHTIPRDGACLLVPNHVSFIDWFVITAACQRPVHFVMYQGIFDIPVLRTIFKLCRAIPIAPAREDPESKERAFELVAQYLDEGEVVCIFPEGQITRDGELNQFARGVEQILATNPVPVIPIGLKGLWGSFFSRERGSAMKGLPHPSRRKIEVAIGRPMAPDSTCEEMQAAVADLLAAPMP
jgi:1-acyl-sn-glycerol-3-phosphate acyltransferase